MVEEAGKEYAEVKTAKDTDSDEFFESLGSAFSEFIAVYNKRLVFDKENVRASLSTATIWAVLRSATRFFCLRAADPKACRSLPTT